MKQPSPVVLILSFAVLQSLCVCPAVLAADDTRPNILVVIADDQSYPHASAYGYEAISTPGFDRVARMGVLFNNAFTPAPGCSPMRAAFLTGRHIWQIEHAGTHASSFPIKYDSYQTRLEDAGYFVGYTGKPWSPGNFKVSGRDRNPAGPSFDDHKLDAPEGIANKDYAANFDDFLKARPQGKPFSFWFGANEPHRGFGKGLGIKNGLDPAKVVVPSFLPDTPEIRADILDYCYEIQWFDAHLVRMLDALENAGELDSTLIVVTSDNGMAFPRAKANCYEFGIHMPLAISWPAKFPANRRVDDIVNLIDVTATIYEVANVAPPNETPLAGSSLVNVLASNRSGIVDPTRNTTYSGRERHSSSRFNTLGYPQRAIRTSEYLYIRNFRPERWPAGAPQMYVERKSKQTEAASMKLGPMHGGYADIDPCPTLDFLIANVNDPDLGRYLHWSVDRRPGEELFNIKDDPGCLRNLANDAEHQEIKSDLSGRLLDYLTRTQDPRVVDADGGDIFETYPRYSGLRWFPVPDWAKENPDKVPKMDWLEELRPK